MTGEQIFWGAVIVVGFGGWLAHWVYWTLRYRFRLWLEYRGWHVVVTEQQ